MKKILVLFMIVGGLSTNTTIAQSLVVDCNNLSLDNTVFNLNDQLDTIVEGNLMYLDTNITVYPFLHLIISDTTYITSSDVMVLSFMQYPIYSMQHFTFNIHFKNTTFPNNQIVNGYFHYYDSDIPGDSTATCYIPITMVLYHWLGINENFIPQNIVSVYPNPAKDKLTISGLTDDQEYSIVNLMGQQLLSGFIKQNEPIINIRAFTDGIYLLKLRDNANRVIRITINH